MSRNGTARKNSSASDYGRTQTWCPGFGSEMHPRALRWDMLGVVTPEEFVEVLRLVVVEQPAEGTVRLLRQPPGRRPWSVDVRRSEWFNSLDESDQQMVTRVAKAAAFASAFQFCSVLDGTTAFDRDHGTLKLLYVAPDGSEAMLNDPTRCELHAELRGDGPPP